MRNRIPEPIDFILSVFSMVVLIVFAVALVAVVGSLIAHFFGPVGVIIVVALAACPAYLYLTKWSIK